MTTYCYGPARVADFQHIADRLTLVSFRGDALRPFLKARICDRCIADMKAAGLEFGNPATTVSDEAARLIQNQADTSFECGEWTNDLDDDYDKVLADSMKADADLTAYVAKLEDSVQALINGDVWKSGAWLAKDVWTSEPKEHPQSSIRDRRHEDGRVLAAFDTAEDALAAFLRPKLPYEGELIYDKMDAEALEMAASHPDTAHLADREAQVAARRRFDAEIAPMLKPSSTEPEATS